jgi:quinol monooxygenase YgiN
MSDVQIAAVAVVVLSTCSLAAIPLVVDASWMTTMSQDTRRKTMSISEGDKPEIRQVARYQVRPEALDRCLAAIREFVAYIHANEPGTLRYEVWQERDEPTRFVHNFIFRDDAAQQIHSESPGVEKFIAVLYPVCLAPVEFTEYHQVTSNTNV